MRPFIHPTAIVEESVVLGDYSKVWHFCHIRKGANIEKDCSIGRDCYVDSDVKIGEGTRIQNGVSIYNGIEIQKYVFVGPHVVFTNDMFPRAGSKKWVISSTSLQTGASIGAGAIIRCGVKIGSFAMVGAGALITKDISPFTLATGFPARSISRICACGRKRFDLLDTEWRPVVDCCYEYLSEEVVRLAGEIASHAM